MNEYKISKSKFQNYIKQFDFKGLFIDMGWDNASSELPIEFNGKLYNFNITSHKKGFRILTLKINDEFPNYALRKQLYAKITKIFEKNIVIFYNNNEQVWSFISRKQLGIRKYVETQYKINQDPELLYQKAAGMVFQLSEEDTNTIIDVTDRVEQNLAQNADKVTKQFYDKFKKEHNGFYSFVKGIDEHIDEQNNKLKKGEKESENRNKQWYVSVMLNRLMFCYFIQKKGFLDNNKNYLIEKLKECKSKKGSNQFFSFYKDFLLRLFHDGLGGSEHNSEFVAEFGKIPYLNGGLFDIHELEKQYESIKIDDEAFEKIFYFFDQYHWHLDSRPDTKGNEINPDVIGYIFEKYINDRAAMGAYYTKEDITEYISKNCIIPFLFDETQRLYNGSVFNQAFQMLKDNSDNYIYDAVKKGIPQDYKLDDISTLFADLSDEIKQGFRPDLDDKIVDGTGVYLCDIRKSWNKSAPESISLPTEIYRELIERRKRYAEIINKIQSGELNTINDFITFNLNITQFAQDTIESTDDPKLIEHFYTALTNVTVLDPTCGSGAFLFAALNILEPLYEACIKRMSAYVEDEDRQNLADKSEFRNNYPAFRKTLNNIKNEHHPSIPYFIYKSIILNNLYGVDIMQEATEIAKLRLFLKLVAAVEADYKKKNLGLEPLPDIDFNIKTGNTLVGFATEKEALGALEGGQLDFYANIKDELREQLTELKKLESEFRIKQSKASTSTELSGLKTRIKDFKVALLMKLNIALAKIFGIDPRNAKAINEWMQSHQPFHWFFEFPEIIGSGGFDVIIGNPPYVVYSENSFDYKILGLSTFDCKDLYAYVIERATQITNIRSLIGMIIPISIVSTDGFNQLRELINKQLNTVWYSSYAMRPAKLFDGVEKHLSIFISTKNNEKLNFTSKYYRWYSEERESLFSLLKYSNFDKFTLHNNSVPKIGTKLESIIIGKIKTNKLITNSTISKSEYVIYHTRKLRYFLQFLESAPKIYEENGKLRVTSELKEINFKSEIHKYISLSSYLSNLFFWYYMTYSDCRNLNKREVSTFPLSISEIKQDIQVKLVSNAKSLIKNLQENSYFQESNYKKYGKLKMQVFQPRLSKPIIDEIDKVLAEHYGFTQAELDFIINYDIKYRLGKEIDNGEEE